MLGCAKFCFTVSLTKVLNLKRDKRELEIKVQEQEEELDEQAGQIQMLEQVTFLIC